MYDALLSTINAPERSEYSFGPSMELERYLGYFHRYCFSEYVRGWYMEVKDLPGTFREVGLALRAENAPMFWEMWLRDEPYSDDDWRHGDD
jgi:hypothetical protein